MFVVPAVGDFPGCGGDGLGEVGRQEAEFGVGGGSGVPEMRKFSTARAVEAP
jgi:hypothetical protein